MIKSISCAQRVRQMINFTLLTSRCSIMNSFVYRISNVKFHRFCDNFIQIRQSQSNSIDLNKNLKDCITLSTLFDLIQPHLNELTPDQLECVCDCILKQLEQMRNIPIKRRRWMVQELKYSIKASPVFKSLLDSPIFDLKDNLNNQCLLKIFELLLRLSFTSEFQPMIEISRKLYDRLRDKELNANEIAHLVRLFSQYDRTIRRREEFYDRFSKLLNERIRNMISSNETNDAEMLITLFSVLLFEIKNENIIKKLTTALISPYCELDFKHAVRILINFKKFTSLNIKKTDLDYSLRLDFDELIDKCNGVITDRLLNGKQMEADALFYCCNLHANQDRFKTIFPNLYDSKIIDLVVPIILKESKKYDHIIFKMIRNLIIYRIADERFLRHAYKSICENPDYLERYGIALYSILVQFDLPFIDRNYLTQLMFNNNINQIYQSISKYFVNSIIMVNDFILNDFEDERLLKCLELLNDKFEALESETIQLLPDAVIRRLLFAKVYFSMYSKLESDLKTKILFQIKQLLIKIMPIRQQTIGVKLLNDARFAENVRHSNGLFILTVAVYDRSIQDLISLTQFENYFYKIDELPLKEHQDLLVFLFKISFKGIEQYSPTSFVKFAKLLKDLNIKFVKINNEEFKNEIRPKSEILIREALNSYK